MRRSTHRALAARVQGRNWALPQFVIFVQHPGDGLVVAKPSVVQREQGASKRAKGLTTRNKLSGNTQHTVNAHGSKVTLLDHAAQAAGRGLPALNELGNGQVGGVSGQKFRHVLQPNGIGRRAATYAPRNLNRIGA